MDVKERAALERELRTAENNLGQARATAQNAQAKMGARVDAVMAKNGDLRNDDALHRLVTTEDAAKTEVIEAQAKRDDLLRKLAGNPLGAVINGHDELTGERRGISCGFNAEMLSDARRMLLGDNPAPVRLGPSLGGDGPLDLQAIANSGDWAQGLVPSYDIGMVFPFLREQPSVAAIFPADVIDAVSRVYFRFSAAASQAAVVAEGSGKPESTPNTEQVTVTPQVVGHFGKFTRQLLLNAPNFLDQYIGEFVAGLNLAVDQGLVSGTGTGELHGISTAAGINEVYRETSNNELRADTILRGITTIRTTAYREPTHLIIHPTDLETVRMERPSTGAPYNYAPFAELDASGNLRNLWGLEVIATTSATLGTAIVLDPVTFGILVVRLPVVAEVDPYSLFTTNEYQLRVETMLDLCPIRAKAACLVAEL